MLAEECGEGGEVVGVRGGGIYPGQRIGVFVSVPHTRRQTRRSWLLDVEDLSRARRTEENTQRALSPCAVKPRRVYLEGDEEPTAVRPGCDATQMALLLILGFLFIF